MKHLLFLLVCLMSSMAQALESPQPVAPPTSALAIKPQELKLSVKYGFHPHPLVTMETKVTVGELFMRRANQAEGGFIAVTGLVETMQENGTYPLSLSYVVGWKSEKIDKMGIIKPNLELDKPYSISGIGGQVGPPVTVTISKVEDSSPQPASTAPPHGKWRYSLREIDKSATLDTEGVTVIFEGVQRSGSSGGSISIAGPGRSSGVAGSGSRALTESYENGVATMTFAGHTLKITDAGRKLIIGQQEFDLSGPKKTIVIRENGKAEGRT